MTTMHDLEFEFEDVQSFNDQESGEQALQDMNQCGSYSYKRSHETSAGKKEEYRCSKVKIRGPQCDSAFQLLYHDDDMSVSLFKTKANHSHEMILEENSRNGIPINTKKLIDQYYQLKITIPSVIIQNLEEAKLKDPSIVIPTLKQLYNHKNNKKNAIPSKFRFSELLNICKQRSERSVNSRFYRKCL